MALAGCVAVAAAVAMFGVYLGVAYALGLVGALVFFLGCAVLVAAGMIAWHRFASRLR